MVKVKSKSHEKLRFKHYMAHVKADGLLNEHVPADRNWWYAALTLKAKDYVNDPNPYAYMDAVDNYVAPENTDFLTLGLKYRTKEQQYKEQVKRGRHPEPVSTHLKRNVKKGAEGKVKALQEVTPVKDVYLGNKIKDFLI